MNLPEVFADLIFRLYLECRLQISIGQRRLDTIFIDSGIKQGCPLSGFVFALVVDPLLRLLMHGPQVGKNVASAYADDVAVVPQKTLRNLPSALVDSPSSGVLLLLRLNSRSVLLCLPSP